MKIVKEPYGKNCITPVTKYYLGRCLHREDGPAVLSDDGKIEEWFLHGRLHREGGPAYKYGHITAWYDHGSLHREDGPASIVGERESYYLSNLYFPHKELWKIFAAKQWKQDPELISEILNIDDTLSGASRFSMWHYGTSSLHFKIALASQLTIDEVIFNLNVTSNKEIIKIFNKKIEAEARKQKYLKGTNEHSRI